MSTIEREVLPPIPPEYTLEEWVEIVAEREALLAQCQGNSGTLPDRRDVDENGRILPAALDAYRERMTRLPQLLEELAAITDESETDEMWDQFMRNIDDERRASGMRTIYDGYY